MLNLVKKYIYDWNEAADKIANPSFSVEVHDETLRDGAQSPAVKQPITNQIFEILRLSDAIGLNSVTIGFPAVGKAEQEKTLKCAEFVAANSLSFKPSCTARTVATDVIPIANILQHFGRPMEASIFLGSSYIRRAVEKWNIDDLKISIKESVGSAAKEGLDVAFVTEDTTRTNPKDIETLYLTAIECGAKRLTLCDTVGHATPIGIKNLIKFVRKMLAKRGITDVKLDFHGHMDRGLGLWNAITALLYGANRIHVCSLGIGERTGNVATEQLLMNLKLLGWINNDLSYLKEYSQVVARIFGVDIPPHQPIIGKQAFETASGVHAAAILKAKKMHDTWLTNRVYSAVPAEWIGSKQIITVGPMSGKANVLNWLNENDINVDEKLIDYILKKAKENNQVLTNSQLLGFVNNFNEKNDAQNKIVSGKALILWQDIEANQKLNNIDTDQITPASFCITEDLVNFEKAWQEGVFRYLIPDFEQRVKQGHNFLIVNDRFGIGSSREMSPAAIQAVAKNNNTEIIIICGQGLGDIFRKNAINLGLCVLEIPEAVQDAQEKDLFQFNYTTWKLTNLTQGKEYLAKKLATKEEEIFLAGGILAIGKKELTRKTDTSPKVVFANDYLAKSRTVTEQILHAHSVNKKDIIACDNTIKIHADLFPASDGTAPFAIYAFDKISEESNIRPHNAAIINDHFAFTGEKSHIKQMSISYEFAKKYKLKAPYYSEPGTGIFHIYLPEKGLIVPGGIYIGADSHSRTYGAYGAIGIGVGSTTLGFGWATGYIYLKIGKLRKVILKGKLKFGVTGKDIALFLLKKWKNSIVHNQHIEFIDIDRQLPLHHRHTICNLMAEAEAQTALFVHDEITKNWMIRKNISNIYPVLSPGQQAKYDYEEVINLDIINPSIACPFSPSNVVSCDDIIKEKIKIDKAIIGSCTNGLYEDLLEAASVLYQTYKQGITKFNNNTEVVIYPGSRIIAQEIEQKDKSLGDHSIAELFRLFGAKIKPSWCGPCFGQGCDTLGTGQIAITTFNRNWQNRIGNGAYQYLASPSSVVSSAILGYIGSFRNL